MLALLTSVLDIRYIVEKFYPSLLKSAGTELVASGVALVIILALSDFEETKDADPKMLALIDANVPDFIDALIDNKDVASEAKRIWEESGA